MTQIFILASALCGALIFTAALRARDLRLRQERAKRAIWASGAAGQATLGVIIAMVDAAGGRIEITPEDFVKAINRRLEWINDPASEALIVTTVDAN